MGVSKQFLEGKVLEAINSCFEDEAEKSKVNSQMVNIGVTNHSKLGIQLLKNVRFRVNDYIEIPIDGSNIRFDVKHVSDKKVYFVSHDILTVCSMTQTSSFLDEFETKLPSELLDIIATNNQKISGNETEQNRKVFIPSLANIGCDTSNRCCGLDDIPFDGFNTQADRCANFKGETDWWWLSTPEDNCDVVSSAYFAYVNSTGYCYSYNASYARGVRPAFGIFIS